MRALLLIPVHWSADASQTTRARTLARTVLYRRAHLEAAYAPSDIADVLAFGGFEGCASDREYKWHLGADDDQLGRFPEVAAYDWTPAPSCNVRQFQREAFVKDLVEQGGWLLIGGECL